MKKFLLVFSFIIPLLFSSTTIIYSKPIDDIEEVENCQNPANSIVRVTNDYEIFKGNGIIYKKDEKYNYIITSTAIIDKKSDYKVLYKNGNSSEASLLGYDKDNEIALIKAIKDDHTTPVCFANSNFLHKGQLNYAYGFNSNNNQFFIKTSITQVGDEYKKNGYLSIYKSIVDIKGTPMFKGFGVFDELNRLIGMITSYDKDFQDGSFIIDSNKLLKIADSILKSGKYKSNYIKYNLEDYGSLSLSLKKSYGVSDTINEGVVITTFKPFSYLFGGLNQGMVIVAINGVKIKDKYELDKQLQRYPKNSNVCLKIINKKGKIEFYHVTI